MSGDGTNWDYSISNNIPTGSNQIITSPVQAKWLRLRITNTAAVATTHMRLFCYGSPQNSAITALLQGVGNLDPAVRVTNMPLSAWGELSTCEDISRIEYVFINGISGTVSPKTYKVCYNDLIGYSNNILTQANFTDGVMTLGSNFSITSKVYMNGMPLKYSAGVGVETRFTGRFYQDSAIQAGGPTQLVGIGNINTSSNSIRDGLFFGYVYQRNEFCIVYYNNGVRTSYPQSAWNVDPCNGTVNMPVLIPGNFNIFEISYTYLGFGPMRFYINNPLTHLPELVHVITRVNSQTGVTNFYSPSMGLCLYQEYEVGMVYTPNATIGIGSFALRTQGERALPFERLAVENSKSIAVANETVVLNIRCSPTFFSKENYWPITTDFLSVSGDGTKNIIVRIYRNPTLSGTVWTDIDQYTAPVQFDTLGTRTLGTGKYLLGLTLAKSDKQVLYLDDFHIKLNPNDTLCVTFTSTAAYDAFVNMSFHCA
jgi:hypothetical protein